MTTIADVAKLAGLSRTTVSRVLNNHPNVAEEKKRLVLEAMERLNYVPNSTAQRLRNQKTDTIAILVPVLTNPFFAYLLEAMDTVATDNNLQLLVCQTRYDREKELNFLSLLKTKQVDGLILTSSENDWDIIAEFTQYGPIVLCNEYSELVNVPTVRMDNTEAAYEAACHLIEQGCKKIAYSYGEKKSSVALERENGFRKALQEYGLPLNKEWIIRNVYDMEDGREALNYLSRLPDKPDAVFTGSDQVATGMIIEAKKQNINIPDDLAIVGFDDQPIASIVEPGLTTIAQPIQQMGTKAMETMIEVILHKRNLSYHEILLPFELIVRDSTNRISFN
ncbi:DNA-binding LacI/PurR family transcriptional regulator [Peribacillus deserti]|uniref:DNA-binding LacI/PurR family transcriptional regulator n=1 Tax=Peribacillus deserti TaxID=673318 RepID=A0ABS2QEK6_9BACI|nr:LacI family DNA-binding transcriptional regulator [Peribacillus deserti]MBM7691259.1 DNA-binding LacI/PurR family transcriptional regulator [Peribacillus deserti]